MFWRCGSWRQWSGISMYVWIFLICCGNVPMAVPSGKSFLWLRYLLCRPLIFHCPRLGVWELCGSLAYVVVSYVWPLLSLLCSSFGFLDECPISIYMMRNDLILLLPDWLNQKCPCLVGVHCVLWFVYSYENIRFLLFNFISFIVVTVFRLEALGGPDPLSLVTHVPFLRFFILR